MQVTRCRICGEVQLVDFSAMRCPYCAAGSQHLTGPFGFSSAENRIQPTETERRSLEDLTEVVRGLARTALGAAEATHDDWSAALFRRVAWTQAEHVRVLCLLADETHGPEWLQPAPIDDIAGARERVDLGLKESAGLYREAAERATNLRTIEVMLAFADAEIALAEMLRR